MKKLQLIMLAGALAVSLNASAQFSNNSSTQSGRTNHSAVITPTYDRLQISYVNEKISPDKGDDQSTNGVGLKWTRGISISKDHPLYVQTGVDLHLGFWSDEQKASENKWNLKQYAETDYKTTITTLNAAIPLNLAYQLNVTPSFAIEPMVGINVKFNILAKNKLNVDTTDEYLQEELDSWDKDDFKDEIGRLEEMNLFDKKDMGDKNLTWKRFQLGWHIGANFIFSQKYYAGITYGSDFMELYKKANSSTLTIGLGYIF